VSLTSHVGGGSAAGLPVEREMMAVGVPHWLTTNSNNYTTACLGNIESGIINDGDGYSLVHLKL